MKLLIFSVFLILSFNLCGQNFKEPIVNPFGINTGVSPIYNAMQFVDIDGDDDFDIIFEDLNEIGSRILINKGTFDNPDFTNCQPHKFSSFDDGSFEGIGLSLVSSSSKFLDLDIDGDLDYITSVSGVSINNPGYFLINYNKIESVTQSNFLFAFDQVEIQGSELGLPNLPPFSLEPITNVDIDNDSDSDLFGIRYDENTGKVTFVFYECLFEEGNNQYKDIAFENPYGLTNKDTSSYFGFPTFIDVELDGDLDLIISTGNGDWHYYENIGTLENPKFDSIPILNPFGLKPLPSFGFIEAIDGNADGNIDLIAGSDGKIHYYEFENPVSLSNLKKETVKIYPNPTSNRITVSDHYNQIKSVSIISMTGEIVFETNNINKNEVEINLSKFVSGIYSIVIEYNNSRNISYKNISFQK